MALGGSAARKVSTTSGKGKKDLMQKIDGLEREKRQL